MMIFICFLKFVAGHDKIKVHIRSEEFPIGECTQYQCADYCGYMLKQDLVDAKCVSKSSDLCRCWWRVFEEVHDSPAPQPSYFDAP